MSCFLWSFAVIRRKVVDTIEVFKELILSELRDDFFRFARSYSPHYEIPARSTLNNQKDFHYACLLGRLFILWEY